MLIRLLIAWLQLRWKTTALNRTMYRMGKRFPAITRAWFSLGVVFGVVAMLAAPAMLAVNVFTVISQFKATYFSTADQIDTDDLSLPSPDESHNDRELPVLVPMVPGVTLPSADLGLFIFTLLLSGFLHEVLPFPSLTPLPVLNAMADLG